MSFGEFSGLMPMLLPAVGGVFILLMVALGLGKDSPWPAIYTLLFLMVSGLEAASLLSRGYHDELFDGAILVDSRALAFHLIFVVVAALTALSSSSQLRAEGVGYGEYFALLLFAVTGMSMMASTGSLLTLFLGLEILSISLYVLAGFTRDRVNAIEGALKYFLLGAFSTGFLLYGIALFYGASGRIDLAGIASHLATTRGGSPDPLVLAATGLVLIGLAFKVAAVPFHFWAPDVYQGSMAPVAGFMAAGTKAAAFAALLRVLDAVLHGDPEGARVRAVLHGLALLTMVSGNVLALAQQNIKRLLAYSSIANAGYLLVAAISGGPGGRGSSIVLFYLAAYAFMTIGAFSVAALVGRAGEEDQGYALSAYAGLSRRKPWLAAAMALFMLSLTGIPPTGGFMGKFYVFKAAMDTGQFDLAIVGLLSSVIGAFYYLRIVVQMYVRDPVPGAGTAEPGPAETLGIALAAAATLWIGLFPGALLALVQGLA
jgi:NADH-quinone oxidoreductase subunit N